MKECPNCKLTNPFEAEICDCGYNFSLGDVGKSNFPKKESKNSNSLFYAYSIILNGLAGLVLLMIITYSLYHPYNIWQDIFPPDKINSIITGKFWYIVAGYSIVVLALNIILCKRMKKKKWFLHFLINLLIIPVFLLISIILIIK